MSGSLDQLIRQHWWAAVATLCRLTGDLDAAEDAVQDACVAALERWPVTGVPGNALGWLIGVARHKAVDRMRREAIRGAKEAASVRELDDAGHGPDISAEPADTLSLMFLCCHPALDASARVALTLRSVCGLPTAQIAAAFLVPEETMAKRLVRAKAKIRDARIPFRVPARPSSRAGSAACCGSSTSCSPRATWPAGARPWSAATCATRRSRWPAG